MLTLFRNSDRLPNPFADSFDHPEFFRQQWSEGLARSQTLGDVAKAFLTNAVGAGISKKTGGHVNIAPSGSLMPVLDVSFTTTNPVAILAGAAAFVCLGGFLLWSGLTHK